MRPTAASLSPSTISSLRPMAARSRSGSPRAARKTRRSASTMPPAAARIAGPIDRAQFGATAWSDDSKTLYFIRLKKLAATACAHRQVQGCDRRFLGSEVRTRCRCWAPASATDRRSLPTEFPVIAISVGAPIATALSINGVQNELAMWTRAGGERERSERQRGRSSSRAMTRSPAPTCAGRIFSCCRTRMHRPSRFSR